MTINEYQDLAMRTLNPQLSKKDVLINGVMGLCGEAGEAIDIVKKHLAQGHDLDREKLIKELGDVAWYLAETAYALDVPLEDVLKKNIEKLKARYPQGFESEKSLNRQENLRIERAGMNDTDEIFALYRSLIDLPYSTWSEDYPTLEIVEEDIRDHEIIVMRNTQNQIVAAISLWHEFEFGDAAAWYTDVTRWGMLSRLGVSKDMQGRGIAKRMLVAAMEAAKNDGCEAVQFLVAKSNPIAQRA